MKNIRLSLFFLLSFFFFLSCVHRRTVPLKPHSPESRVQKQIEGLLHDPNLASAQIGVYVENLKDGTVLFQRNTFKRFIPASNMKLYTAATAIDRLGPEFRFETGFYRKGEITENGILEGDLVVRGKGDPTISGRFKDDDILGWFRDWADSLKNHGIREINGDLIGDESYFKGDKLGLGWQWDDEPYWYSAQINALSFNDNCVDLTIAPADSAGTGVIIKKNPSTAYMTVINKAVTVHPDSQETIRINRQRAENIIEISGQLPLKHKPLTESITVENPGMYFLQHFHNVLDSSGITVKGMPRLAGGSPVVYDSLLTVFVHHSPPLSELVRVVNKGSHNFYADQLFKTLGAKAGKRGDWRTASDVVKGWLRGAGAATDQVSVFDGSGLSRINLVTPHSTAALLREMYFHSDFQVFYESLPIAGIDGTLKRRMRGTAAENNVRAKTGYVMHVRSLSGYVNDRNDTPYLFVIMANHYAVPTPYINKLQDRICVLLSNMGND